jgi:hypothetical protein
MDLFDTFPREELVDAGIRRAMQDSHKNRIGPA